MKKYIIIALAAVSMMFASCELDTAPSNQAGNSAALGSLNGLIMSNAGLNRAILTYSPANQQGNTGYHYTFIRSDIAAGIITRPVVNFQWYNRDYLQEEFVIGTRNGTPFQINWRFPFNIIRRANEIIQSASALEVSSEVEKKQLNDILAQSYVIRALMYHTLNINFAQRYTKETAGTVLSVPIRETASNEPLVRESQEKVVEQILKDIESAITHFGLGANETAVNYPTVNAAKLLKARVLLYTLNYDEALIVAKDVIATSEKSIMGVDNYNSGWIDSNSEWIWGGGYDVASNPGWSSYRRYMAWDFQASDRELTPNGLDASYLLGRSNADLVEGEVVEGGLTSTMGNTMSTDDARAKLYVLDTPEQIAVNIAADPGYYVDRGFATRNSWVTIQGLSKKYKTEGGTQGLGDICYMRLAEAYYIAAECEAINNNDGLAGAHLAATVLPYDPNFIAKTGEDLKQQIYNYKAVDMWGEGRIFEDVKRRGDWVYRLKKYHPTLSTNTYQYKSLAPYMPTSVTRPFADILTLPVPESAMQDNNLLVQNPL